MKSRPLLVLIVALLVTGCGPFALGTGASTLFGSETPDLGEPVVSIQVLDGDGREQAAPEFAKAPITFLFKTSKPGVRLSVLLVGPVPPGTPDADLLAIEQPFCGLGIVAAGASLPTTLRGDLSTIPSENTSLNALLAGLLDGLYVLHLRGVDGSQRVHCTSHAWIHDTLAPAVPRLVSVDRVGPRSIAVLWTAA